MSAVSVGMAHQALIVNCHNVILQKFKINNQIKRGERDNNNDKSTKD